MSALVAEIRRTSALRVVDDPSRSNSPRLEHAQELLLLAQRDVGDLVEEERAAVGQLEPADAILPGVGERALHVAEQLALEDAFRHAAGVDRDHRPRGARDEAACSACATSPLPVPFSPVMSTLASEGPTRAMTCEDRPHRRRLAR